MMITLLAIALGGAVGTLMRYGMTLGIGLLWPGIFPLATFCINLLGCLAIGVVYGLWLNRPELSPLLQQSLMVGFLGGFTTFSSFSLDALRLLENDQSFMALIYVLLSVCLGLTATWAGLSLTR